jgi:hypothetical protein
MPGPPRPSDDKKRDDLDKEYRELRDKVQADATGPILARLGDVCIELQRMQEAVSFYSRALQADIPGAAYLATRIKNKLTPDEFAQLTIPPPITPISEAVGDILFYPFRGNGLGLIGIGSVFFAIFRFIIAVIGSGMLIFRFIAFILLIYMSGYLLSYYISILKKTAFHGDYEPPGWPDLTNIIGDLVKPVVHLFLTLLMGFFPTIIGLLVAWRLDASGTVMIILAVVLSIFGVIVWPMLLMIVYIFNHIGAVMNPRFVFKSIAEMGMTYVIGTIFFYLIVGAFFVIMFAESFFFSYLGLLPMIPFLPFLWFARIYIYMVAFRLLGLMYREKAHVLRWFT